MSFPRTNRFADKSSSHSGSAESSHGRKSRNSSCSREKARSRSKESTRSRSLESEKVLDAIPVKPNVINIDDIPVGPQRKNDTGSTVILHTNESATCDNIENETMPLNLQPGEDGEANVKSSPSTTSKKGLSSIPVRTSSAPPKVTPKSSPRQVKTPISARTKVLASPERTLRGETPSTKQIPTQRSLELDFYKKKKKFDAMKKEFIDKQKPVVESYQSLVQLKKKIEESGSEVILETMKFFVPDSEHKSTTVIKKAPNANKSECSTHNIINNDKGDLVASSQIRLVPQVTLEAVKDSLKAIPRGIMDVCKNLHTKRLEIIATIENSGDPNVQKRLLQFKSESREFEDELLRVMDLQEKQTGVFLSKWVSVIDKGMPQVIMENDSLKKKIEEQEKTILDLYKQVNDTNELQDRVKELEVALQTEKHHVQESKEKNASVDQKTRAMKLKMRDVENRTKEYESKISDLQNHLQQAQTAIRTKERQWEKEKQEFHKMRKQDQQVIEKMTKDKASTESRLKATSDLLVEKEEENKKIIKDFEGQIAGVNKKWMDDKLGRDELQAKNDFLKEEITKLQAANQEAVDVMKNRREDETGDHPESTMREKELLTELKATQVALKDAQEQLETLSIEKMRFIESIEKLSEHNEEGKNGLAKTLFKKDEEISTLSSVLKEKNEQIDKLIIESKKMEAKLEFTQAKLGAVQVTQEMDASTAELKDTINEGKLKLEYALKKSLDNEQKVIRYQSEMEKQQKQINDMENLLKVRDGLIGMIKMKKDELVEKNDSLMKYASELRKLLFEAKNELNMKAQTISELSISLQNYQKQNLKLDKKVSDLEGVLSNTNEKRYKLQDTIGTMEKELQHTKAHVTHLTELQSRYDDTEYNDIRKCNSMPQRTTNATTTAYKRYKSFEKHHRKRSLTLKKGSVKTQNSTIIIPKRRVEYEQYDYSEPYYSNVDDSKYERNAHEYRKPLIHHTDEFNYDQKAHNMQHSFDNTAQRTVNFDSAQRTVNFDSAPQRPVNFDSMPQRTVNFDSAASKSRDLMHKTTSFNYDKMQQMLDNKTVADTAQKLFSMEPQRTHVNYNRPSTSQHAHKVDRNMQKYAQFNNTNTQDNTIIYNCTQTHDNVVVCTKPTSYVKLTRTIHHRIVDDSCEKLRKSIDDSLHMLEEKYLRAKSGGV